METFVIFQTKKGRVKNVKKMLEVCNLIKLTLFHIASEPTYFTFQVSSPPSNFVIFKDRDLKFGDDLYFLILNQSYFKHHARFFNRQPAFC